MTFSEQVSKYRRAAKMTQEELAEKCDVTRQAVAKCHTLSPLSFVMLKS